MAGSVRDGDLVTVCPISFESIRRGDVVLCRGADGQPLVHRVIRTWKGPRGAGGIQTKGDAVKRADARITRDMLVGKIIRVERARADAPSRVIRLDSLPGRCAGLCRAWIGFLGVALRSRWRRLLARAGV